MIMTPPLLDEKTIPDRRAGLKFDDGKIDLTFVTEYFPLALQAVALVSAFGARKYTRGGWRTVTDRVKRYAAARLRHIFAGEREDYDTGDSGLPHDAQVAWNALAKLQARLEDKTLTLQTGNDIDANGKPVLGTSREVPPL